MKTYSRIKKIVIRSALVLGFLQAKGPSVLTRIARDLDIEPQRTRYALATLRMDKKAHITKFDRVTGTDNIPRMVAVFKAGEGRDATLPGGESLELDFASTLHLQSIYVPWSATRTPDYVWDEA